ncbi:hypothetical protein GPZ77_27410 [Streptomyces sp. QHH-9511]|uniref:hypothetical protein n=1 Tax=Streptomyces sp. QHH-9511 TaxID=2684468 RepID=UPI001317034F|nr:hypothetical protein [Streptomyces sp. QHH-9511]QGZ51615.1 hypothetical protein GPZ77_27410 [Streptomyces sp. QHH-9511]
MPLPPRLLVADQVAGGITVLDLPSGRTVAVVEGRHLAEHAGFLALPGGRSAFVDELAGELVVLDPYGPEAGRPLTETTVPVATPAEHLAADASGRRLAVTTGLGRNEEPWSDLLTVVELRPGRRPLAARVRTRTGEPGVTLVGEGDSHEGTDPLVVLRHREPGTLTAYPWAALLGAAPSCPPAAPAHELPLPDDDGHGDAYDPESGRLFAAAGSGVHRARREGTRLAAEEPLGWAGPGRGYYLRLDPVRRTLWSCVRGGPADPGRWPEWTNDAWFHHLGSGLTGRVPLGPGLVFRLAVAASHIAYARVHPDGDELVLLDPSALRPRVTARLPLPPMDGAPRPGGTPWDGVQRRAIAASPGAAYTAVTRGGHGEIHLFEGERALTVLKMPTPLDDGGHLALVAPGDGAQADRVGR